MDQPVKELYRQLKELSFPQAVSLKAPAKPPFDLAEAVVAFVLEAVDPENFRDLWAHLDRLLVALGWGGESQFTGLNQDTYHAKWPALVEALLYLVEIIGYRHTPRDLRGEEELDAAIEAHITTNYYRVVFGEAPDDAEDGASPLGDFSQALEEQISDRKHNVYALQKHHRSLENEVQRRHGLEQSYKNADTDLKQLVKWREDITVCEQKQAKATEEVDAQAEAIDAELKQVQARVDNANEQLKARGLTIGALASAVTELRHVNESITKHDTTALQSKVTQLEEQFTDARCGIEALVDGVQITPRDVPIDSIKQETAQALAKAKTAEEESAVLAAKIADLEEELRADPGVAAEELRQLQKAVEKRQQAVQDLKRRFDEEQRTNKTFAQKIGQAIEADAERLETREQESRTTLQRVNSERNTLEIRVSLELDPLIERVNDKRQRLDKAVHELEQPVNRLLRESEDVLKLQEQAQEQVEALKVEEPELEENVLETVWAEFGKVIEMC